MSSKKIFVLAALFAVSLLGLISGAAQIFAAPSRLMLKGDEKEEEEFNSGSLLREHFYPIGWSKDGKFAFYVEPADEACGCYISHFVIQDLRTDKILWEKKHMGSEEKEESLETFWKQNQREFSRRLAQYGIRAQKQFTLYDAAFKYGRDTLTPELNVNTKTDDGFYVTGDVRLQLLSKEKGRKTIYQKKFDPKKIEGFLGAELAGSLLSPFEPRAVIVMLETYRGWEGPPHVTRVRIIGTALTTGFQ